MSARTVALADRLLGRAGAFEVVVARATGAYDPASDTTAAGARSWRVRAIWAKSTGVAVRLADGTVALRQAGARTLLVAGASITRAGQVPAANDVVTVAGDVWSVTAVTPVADPAGGTAPLYRVEVAR